MQFELVCRRSLTGINVRSCEFEAPVGQPEPNFAQRHLAATHDALQCAFRSLRDNLGAIEVGAMSAAVRARHAAHACSSAIPWSPSPEPSPRREQLRERSSGSRSIIGSVSDGSQAVLCSPLERQISRRFRSIGNRSRQVLRNAKVSYKNLTGFTTNLKDWASPAILLRERLHPSSASTLSLWGLDPAMRGCPGAANV